MNLDSIPCDLYVDISGTDCAVPFSKLNDALEVIQSGETLIAVSKKTLLSDIPAFCRQGNVQLIDQSEAVNQFYFFVRLPEQ